MGYPPPNSITSELEDESCWWGNDNGPCSEPAVTTYYDDFRRGWIPVCDRHRGGHYYAHEALAGAGQQPPSEPGGESV